MYIIAGLGNPGREYEGSRHNMGFEVIDALIERNGIRTAGTKFHALFGAGTIAGQKVVLAKPLTYMNLSGTSVQELINFYKIDPEHELIIVSDDIDLVPGRLRIRKSGSAGGHNGLKDIISKIGTQNFIRVRVGTGGKPEGWDLADYVLARFSKEDRIRVDSAIENAAQAVETIIANGVEAAMNQFNAVQADT